MGKLKVIMKKTIKPGIIIFFILEILSYILASLIIGCAEPPGVCPTIFERFIMLNYFVIPILIGIYLIIVLILYFRKSKR